MPKLDLGDDLENILSSHPPWQAASAPPAPLQEQEETSTEEDADKIDETDCFYSGVILLGKGTPPPSIILEHMCEKVLEDGSTTNFEGQHREVKRDKRGRYAIPFRNAYLKMRSGQPVVVFLHRGKWVIKPLKHQEGRLYDLNVVLRKFDLTPILDDSWAP
ncbi:hypothetical protein JXD20_01995 [Candidatus Peregrinibacteria bacterium]|nr:hypothetical protein [Candidatus Peregrinibacteria bacterium]